MNGPGHFRRAEALLSLAAMASSTDDPRTERITAVAQIHATLAVAAAIAGLDSYPNPNGFECATGRVDRDDWQAVMDLQPDGGT